MTQFKGWTEDELETLRDMWARGFSASQIARALGCTRNAVCGKVHRLKLPRDEPAAVVERQTPPRVPEKIKHAAALSRGHKVALALATVPTLEELPDSLPRVLADVSHLFDSVLLIEAASDRCRWPVGGDRATLKVCNRPVSGEGSPYCSEHHARAYVPREERRAFDRKVFRGVKR